MNGPGATDDPAEAALIDAWCKLDHASAFVAADRRVVEDTRALRGLVCGSLLAAPHVVSMEAPATDAVDRDLLHAFAAIGRVIAEGHGSPTLASATLDNLMAALGATAAETPLSRAGPLDAPLAQAARAAIFESYVHVTRGASNDEASLRWEYPACVVPLPDGSVAIAAGHPVDDQEALDHWASRVAHALALAGVRRSFVSGPAAAARAVLDALEVAGIAAIERPHPTARTAQKSAR